MSDASRDLLEDAQRRYRAGFRARAARICGRIRSGDPYHGQALELLGIIRLESGETEDAAGILGDAVRLNPAGASPWAKLAIACQRLGRAPLAHVYFRRSTLLAPDALDASRGLAASGPETDRTVLLRRCVILAPLDKDARLHNGLALHGAGDIEAASRQFRRLLIVDPANPDGYLRLGNALLDLDDGDGATKAYLRTLQVEPRSGTARNNLGLMAFGKEEFAAAEQWFAAAAVAAPGLAEAWLNHARAQRKLDPAHDALSLRKRGLVLEPAQALACCEIAASLNELKWIYRARALDQEPHQAFIRMAVLATLASNRDGVVPWLRRAAIAKPNDSVAWYDLAIEAGLVDDLEQAVRYGTRAVQIEDDHVSARRNRAFALLSLERFEEGWRAHTRRLSNSSTENIQRFFDIPEWDGAALADRHLLLWGEQGIGDEVQFLTLLPYLLRLRPRVTVLTEPRLRPIIKRGFPGVTVPDVGAPSGTVEDHHGADVHLAIGDLPHRLDLFCGGAAAPEPWIIPDPERVAALRSGFRARHPGRRLVGITWRSVSPKADERRTVPPPLWKDIAAVPGIALVALQYGVTEEDLSAFAEAGIEIDNGHGVDPLQSLDDLAALVAAMDLVICPTNNTVHFAGALSVPCWVLLGERPDWRWGRRRDNSLWYSNTRVFRRGSEGDWTQVLARVAGTLNEWVSRVA